MKKLSALISEFSAIDDYLDAVRDILRNGHMPDMAGLDGRVSHLCAAIEQTDSEIQQRCLAKLDALLQRLDICETEIRDFHAALSKKVERHD